MATLEAVCTKADAKKAFFEHHVTEAVPGRRGDDKSSGAVTPNADAVNGGVKDGGCKCEKCQTYRGERPAKDGKPATA